MTSFIERERDEKYWTYVIPKSETDMSPEYITKSESEILKEYYPFWSKRMKEIGKEDLIDEQNCLDDWIGIHWAWAVEDKQ